MSPLTDGEADSDSCHVEDAGVETSGDPGVRPDRSVAWEGCQGHSSQSTLSWVTCGSVLLLGQQRLTSPECERPHQGRE